MEQFTKSISQFALIIKSITVHDDEHLGQPEGRELYWTETNPDSEIHDSGHETSNVHSSYLKNAQGRIDTANLRIACSVTLLFPAQLSLFSTLCACAASQEDRLGERTQ